MDINLGFSTEGLKAFFAFSGFCIFILAMGSGIMVLRSNFKPLANRYYSFMSFAIGAWGFFHFLWLFKFSNDYGGSLLMGRLLNFSSLWIPLFHFHWIIYLLQEEDIPHIKFMSRVLWVSTFLLAPFFFTPYYIPSVKEMLPGIYWMQAGPLVPVFLGIYIIFPGYSTVRAIRALFRVDVVKRKQLWIIITLSVVGFSGGFTNYPQWFGVSMWPWGHPLVAFYVVMVTYAMVKYRLMEIETVIHKTLLWAVASSTVFIPIVVFIYFTRQWLDHVGWFSLSVITTILFFIYLVYHRKIQPYIDHFFRRRKYDYHFLLKEIPSRISGILDINVLSDHLLSALKDTLYPKNLILMVKNPEQNYYRIQDKRGYEAPGDRETKEIYVLDEKHPLVDYCLYNNEVLEKDVVRVDPKYAKVKDQFLDIFEKLDLQLFLPLRIEQEEKIIGFLGLGKRETLNMYTLKDSDLLLEMSPQIAISVDNALYHQDILEKQSLLQQISLAKELQRSLLPPNPSSSIEGIKIYGLLHPAKEVGGDYYDFIYHAAEKNAKKGVKLCIAVGDVSGKGVDAGIIMAMTKTTVFTLSLEEELTPREILKRTNQILYYQVNQRKFVSLLYFYILPRENKFIYSSAGHEHIFIYRAGGKAVEVIQSGGVVLGMLEDIDRFLEEHVLMLESGDKILLYTDGVTEARNPQEEFFGRKRLQESFQKHGHLPIKEAIHNIYAEVTGFISSREQYDDITLVGIEKEE